MGLCYVMLCYSPQPQASPRSEKPKRARKLGPESVLFSGCLGFRVYKAEEPRPRPPKPNGKHLFFQAVLRWEARVTELVVLLLIIAVAIVSSRMSIVIVIGGDGGRGGGGGGVFVSTVKLRYQQLAPLGCPRPSQELKSPISHS